MDPILVYSLGLLFYNTLRTVEQLRLTYHIGQLIKAETIAGRLPDLYNGSNRAGRATG